MKLATFDCAGTLVSVDCSLFDVLAEASAAVGISLDSSAIPIFQAMFLARKREFDLANETKVLENGRQFWLKLTSDWLRRIGADSSLALSVQEWVEEACFGANSRMFSLYPDSIPALSALRDAGWKIGVISNWDYSLHLVLERFELTQYFDFALASLEEGWEKPDVRIFNRAVELAGVASRKVHVGDDPVDDIEGGSNAGFETVLIDRSGATGDAIRSLSELELLLK
ncbi:hypothetical protein BH11ARM1_BH11ARM1_11070 [soil metagenome]